MINHYFIFWSIVLPLLSINYVSIVVNCFVLYVTALPHEEVTLNSTLNNGVVAYPQQKLVFTCVTRGSLILEWCSDEYIGRNGDRLQLLSVNCVGANVTSDNSDASATCLSVFNVNGTVIVSELHVTASLQHPQSTVSCKNAGLGSSRIFSFQTSGVTFVDVAWIHTLIHALHNLLHILHRQISPIAISLVVSS